MAIPSIDFETLADIQGRRADGEAAATEELIALGEASDSELWNRVAQFLRSNTSTRTESLQDSVERHFDALRPHGEVFFNDGRVTSTDPRRVSNLRGVFSLSAEDWPAAFSGCPELNDIHRIRVSGDDELTFEAGKTDAGFARCVEEPFCHRLVDMEWEASGLTVRSGKCCGRSDLSNLRRLSFYWENLEPEGIEEILRNPTLENLCTLEFDFCGGGSSEGWTAESLADLDSAAFAGTLRHLKLDSCFIPTDALGGFCENETLLECIVDLDFGDGEGEGCNLLRDEGAQILADCPHTRSLRRLGIGDCTITDDGLTALIESETFPNLETLHLGRRSRQPSTFDFSDKVVARAEERFDTVEYPLR